MGVGRNELWIERGRIVNEVEASLRALADAYPFEIFTPLPKEDILANANVVTRASAAMGRHYAKTFLKAADEIARLTAIIEKTAETCNGELGCEGYSQGKEGNL